MVETFSNRADSSWIFSLSSSISNTETDALIQYVINGIPADTNKIILYGDSWLDEFKNKIKRV